MSTSAEQSDRPSLDHSHTDHSGHIIPHGDDAHHHHKLPAYSQNAKEFTYSFNSWHTFLELVLLADGSFSKTKPIFVQGAPVQGRIQLKLDHADSFSKVVVTVNGFLLTGDGSYGCYKVDFLEQELTVWSHEGKAKLHGEYTWPFSIHLPEEVEINPNAAGGVHQQKRYRLPHTFGQAGVESSIRYEISVKLVRNSIFKTDQTLSAPFVYIPTTRPPPLPAARRIAYEQGKPIPGPDADPDGWHLEKSIHIEGAFLEKHSAHVEIKLFLAKPLTYTRGSFIPLFLTLESDDEEVLNLLSSPKVIAARVRREIKWPSDSHGSHESWSWKNEAEHSQRAVWWPAAANSDEKGVRRLNGELHLKAAMEPDCDLPHYGIHYSVVLFQFDTAGQAADSKHPSEVLVEQPIKIVTSFAPGPRPKASTQADYKPDGKGHAGELQVDGEFSRGFY